MDEKIKKIAEEIFVNPRMQAFFKNPPPEGQTPDGDYPANEECCEIVDEIAEAIEKTIKDMEKDILEGNGNDGREFIGVLNGPVESVPGTAEQLPCGSVPCLIEPVSGTEEPNRFELKEKNE